MWTTFFPDVLVGIIVAALTALFGWFAYRHEQKRQERAAVRRLIGGLARRRAFNIADAAVQLVDAGPGDHDFDTVVRSVISVRKAIDEARVASREQSAIHPVLDHMTADCNSYLECSHRVPNTYIIELSALRASLSKRIATMHSIHSSLPLDEPGSKAF